MKITVDLPSVNAKKTNRWDNHCRSAVISAIFKHFLSVLSCRSIWRFFVFAIAILVTFLLIILSKTHARKVLLWLDTQDNATISIAVILLFIIVSLPISIGYILLVIGCGYLFGLNPGIPLVIFGANFGLLVANGLIKLFRNLPSIRRMIKSDFAAAMVKVISGPMAFKIVLFARLTPIPFGLQNTIFSLSDVPMKIYHTASLIGLLPAQLIGVYAGTTLRSMQDIFENQYISTATYFVVGFQLIFSIGLLLWFGAKARNELMRALAAADDTYSDCSSYNMV